MIDTLLVTFFFLAVSDSYWKEQVSVFSFSNDSRQQPRWLVLLLVCQSPDVCLLGPR